MREICAQVMLRGIRVPLRALSLHRGTYPRDEMKPWRCRSITVELASIRSFRLCSCEAASPRSTTANTMYQAPQEPCSPNPSSRKWAGIWLLLLASAALGAYVGRSAVSGTSAGPLQANPLSEERQLQSCSPIKVYPSIGESCLYGVYLLYTHVIEFSVHIS
jgi:hypothetical protein